MPDPCLQPLLSQLQLTHGDCLWLADEQQMAALPLLAPYTARLQLISNRFDIAEGANTLGLNCRFNDWVLADLGVFDEIFLRVHKEKPVNQHLLENARQRLKIGGHLWLAGEKNEGIKSYQKMANSLFEENPPLHKQGNAYWAKYTRNDRQAPPPVPTTDYHQIRPIGQWQGRDLYSKPGVYGWNKLDQGSVLLAEQAMQLHAQAPHGSSVLDLGCGYGFLTIASLGMACPRRVATDNNAAALLCAEYNARQHSFELEVVPGDCGDTVSGTFDWILCNPPFHKGFDVDSDLTRRFLQAARDKLAPQGVALFVVNSFIPLEKKCAGLFANPRTLYNDKQFKVIALRNER